jgi:hypothetical protein
LSEHIWLTISVGSTGCVGSWFCSSVTRRFRKVLSRSFDDNPEGLLDEPVDEFVELAAVVALPAL